MAHCQIGKISGQELLEFVRNELVCTIGSADAPVTIPVLITTFRDDTNEDLLELAKKLGHPSIEAMLESKDCSDIVESCYTDLAKGAGNENPKKVFSYRVKSNPVIAHILSSIEESKQYKNSKEAEKWRKLEVLIGDPKYNPSILAGKERLVSLIYHLGGCDSREGRFVDLTELQKAYKEVHQEELNKAALKRFFPTGQLKSIMDRYLYQDVELATDERKNGSLLFKLKRPYKEICAEILHVAKEREQHQKELELRKAEEGRKKVKKPKGPAQMPKKLKVLKPRPQPKPKPVPLVKSMIKRASELYTDDLDLFHKITSIGRRQDDEEEEEEEEELQSRGTEEMKKYTSRVEGATYTDEEEGGGDVEEAEEDDDDGGDGEEEDPEWHDQQGSADQITETKSAQNSKNERIGSEPAVEEEEKPEEKPMERAEQRMKMVYERAMRKKAFEEQVMKRNKMTEVAEGVFEETKRFGRRAREEEARRERVAKLMEKMGARMAEKAPMVVDDRMSENSKRRLAALVVQLIWANRELGISEVKNMLKLLFGCEVHMDVERFVDAYCKCVKKVRAPIEPHLVIIEGRRRDIAYQIGGQGKIFRHKQRLVKL